MALTIDTIKTQKSSQLKTELNNYSTGKAKAIEKLKNTSIFAMGNEEPNVSNMGMNGSIFNNARMNGGTDASAAQSNNNQKATADSSSMNLSTVWTKVNDAINNVAQKFEAAIDQIKNSLAELSALASPQTTGQAVNPQENMPTDNQGTQNKAAQPKDNNRPNVGFGEEKVDNKAETENPEKAERENDVQQAQTGSEIDKATLKEIDKQYTQHYEMGTNNLDSIFSKAEEEMAGIA